VWDAGQNTLTPEAFARAFCADLDLPAGAGVADTIAAQIRAQLEDGEPIAGLRTGADIAWADARQPRPGDNLDVLETVPEPLLEFGEEIPECRVIVAVNHFHTCDAPMLIGDDIDRRANWHRPLTRPY
jgi:chromatin structure-remodeling complex subunit SFH1